MWHANSRGPISLNHEIDKEKGGGGGSSSSRQNSHLINRVLFFFLFFFFFFFLAFADAFDGDGRSVFPPPTLLNTCTVHSGALSMSSSTSRSFVTVCAALSVPPQFGSHNSNTGQNMSPNFINGLVDAPSYLATTVGEIFFV